MTKATASIDVNCPQPCRKELFCSDHQAETDKVLAIGVEKSCCSEPKKKLCCSKKDEISTICIGETDHHNHHQESKFITCNLEKNKSSGSNDEKMSTSCCTGKNHSHNVTEVSCAVPRKTSPCCSKNHCVTEDIAAKKAACCSKENHHHHHHHQEKIHQTQEDKKCCSHGVVKHHHTAPDHNDVRHIHGHSENHHHDSCCKSEKEKHSHHDHGHDNSKHVNSGCSQGKDKCKEKDEVDASPHCVAVVQENGTEVVVFDAKGSAKTFQVPKSDRSKGNNGEQLCFSSHGDDNDDFLTPCFDEDGNHGTPVESCFCGVETPHLHAHLKDPGTCNPKRGQKTNKIGFLASQILHPVINCQLEGSNEQTALLSINVSESMPNECNSKQVFHHKSSLTSSQKTDDSRRLHAVKHADHVDYLVHNRTTGQLHLEHPCSSCGQDDVHGRFRTIGKRRIRPNETKRDIHVHFFEVDTRPFKIKEFLYDLFELSSDRVNAVDNILESPTHRHHCHGSNDPLSSSNHSSKRGSDNTNFKFARSTLECSKICCASEIPIINKILTPILGVKKVLINVPLKLVSVDHDPNIVTASQLAATLNWEKMGATVQRDGGAAMKKMDNNGDGVTAVDGRSQFHVQNICCASEIPAINRILKPVPGVKAVSINTTTKIVYVDHEFGIVSAKMISETLSQQGFEATIRFDGGTPAPAPSSTYFARSILSLIGVQDINEKKEAINSVFMSIVPKHSLESFTIDVDSKSILLTHNPLLLTVASIATQLKAGTGIETAVTQDGSDPSLWKFPLTDDHMGGDDASTDREMHDAKFSLPRPTVLISGLLWIISMLSYIGGNL
jgi:copper chaperone CopZ